MQLLKKHIGPLLWVFSAQYFIVQFIVALAWDNPYSLAHNTISDLGNTACGVYGSMYVCSPLHGLMNVSFVLLGLGQLLGALYMRKALSVSLFAKVAFACMLVAGAGTMLVGLFPENTVAVLHVIGAASPFLIGNLGILLFGLSLPLRPGLKVYTILSGGLALIASGLFASHTYLGLGNGGMERLTAYPQTIWLVIFGVHMYRSQVRNTELQASKL